MEELIRRVESATGPRQFAMFGSDARMTLVGKKAAGRLLDGVEHNGMPDHAA